MRYIATPSGPAVRAAMSAGLLAAMTTPAQRNVLPDGVEWAADNGRFGKGWPGHLRWYRWLAGQADRYGTERCLFAVAPDVPFNAQETLAESLPWLPRIRELGLPAAFAAQEGSEQPGMIPWKAIDVIFLGGGDDWKCGPGARRVAAEARERGLRVHMGRVNTRNRLHAAEWLGADTVDGTTLAFGPDRNLPQLLRWLAQIERRPTLMHADHDERPGVPRADR